MGSLTEDYTDNTYPPHPQSTNQNKGNIQTNKQVQGNILVERLPYTHTHKQP